MRLNELRQLDQCPEWLKTADIVVYNESVDVVNGTVIWYNGTWENGVWYNGTWESGTWKNGKWYNGTWESGTWKNGIWYNGTWEDGTWENGVWENGKWYSGTWYNGKWSRGTWEDGIWYNGTWYNGTWYNGTWENGVWYNGTWEDGYKQISLCKWVVSINPTSEMIKIGCKKKTIEEWEEFFESDKVYNTERNTEQFEKIYKSYLVAKYAIEIDNSSIDILTK